MKIIIIADDGKAYCTDPTRLQLRHVDDQPTSDALLYALVDELPKEQGVTIAYFPVRFTPIVKPAPQPAPQPPVAKRKASKKP